MFMMRRNLVLLLLLVGLAAWQQRASAPSANEGDKTGAQPSKPAKDNSEAKDDEDEKPATVFSHWS
jgi:hypothetical protein